MADEAASFQGDAEAILAISENADEGIADLVDAYKGSTWDKPEEALQIVSDYSDRLRQKYPSESNLLSREEVMQIAPPEPNELVLDWEEKNLAKVELSQDPYIRAYEATIKESIEDVATQEIQKENAPYQITDKITRAAMGAIPGWLKALGVEKDFERNLRADSNDTLASAVSSGVGSILSLPIIISNTATNIYAFGKEEFGEARASGASIPRAAAAATIEAGNQVLDSVLDKFFLGGKVNPAKSFVAQGLKKSLGEGTNEVLQNKVSEYADYVGLSKEELDLSLKPADATAFAAGAIVGGVAQVAEDVRPGLLSGEKPEAPVVEAPPVVEDTFFKEVEPPRKIAVVGEQAYGGAEVTTVEEAPTGDVGAAVPVAESDAGEFFVTQPDGSLARVVDGEKKQTHSGAIVVSEDDAKKIALLQSTDSLAAGPVIIERDDLGRPFINHPNVNQDLTLNPEPVNADPVLLTPSDTGHVVQVSERLNDLGSSEHSATVSKGRVNSVSTAGAQQIKESSIADKLRASNINPRVKELLDLGEDISALFYVPNSNEQSLRDVNRVFKGYENNYVAFANDLINKDYGDITPIEAAAAGFAGASFEQRATELQETDPAKSEVYANLAVDMFVASQRVGSTLGQELQQRKIIPITGATVVTATRSQGTSLATAKVAQENNLSVQQVENVQKENTKLDALDEQINEAQDNLNVQEAQAEKRATEPDEKVETLEKELSNLDQKGNAEVEAAQKEVDRLDAETNRIEQQAAALEKEASDLELEDQPESDKVKSLQEKLGESEKVKALQKKKAALEKPGDSPKVKTAKEKVKVTKDLTEKKRAQIELQKVLDEEKAKGIRERAELDRQITEEKERHAAEQKAIKEQIAAAKALDKEQRKEQVKLKRKEAADLRAKHKAEKFAAEQARKEAKKITDEQNKEEKARKKEQLKEAKRIQKETDKIRKEQLAQEKLRLKKERDSLDEKKQKIAVRRERNKTITDAVDKYKKEFAAKLTPETVQKITDLVRIISTGSGLTRQRALEALGKTIADVKGIKPVPGSPWLTTFWSANVLSSLSTNTANIVGNVAAPVNNVISDITRGNFNKAGRFIRGWTGAIFSGKSIRESIAALKGELPSRKVEGEDIKDKGLLDIASGIAVFKETDPVRSLQLKFGTGKLGKFLSSPAISLRLLGAMDAVFYRAAQEGQLARETFSYDQYLALKASDYDTHLAKAQAEKAELDKLGVETPKNFVERRADELSFASEQDTIKERVTRKAKRDIFQSEDGARGAVGKGLANVLNAVGNISLFGKSRYTDLNAQKDIAASLGFRQKVARNETTIDQVYPLVVRGMEQGQTLVINGKEVTTGINNTSNLLGTLVDALNKKQLISLKGDSIKPFKFAVGMFVNTASQITDLSMQTIPMIGYLDQRFGGTWKDFSPEEKAELYGTQIATSALSAALLSYAWDKMDEEETAPFYIYGGMRDEKLREYYKTKGIKPFSIRVGNTVFYYKDIPGMNLLFGGIGEIADAQMVAKRTPDRPISTGESLKMIAAVALYPMTQMSLLKNLGTLADLIGAEDTQGLKSAADVVSNMTNGLVPFSGAARELERFVYGDLSRAKSLENRMLQNIPLAKFVSDNKPALNLFGEPVRTTVLPGISRFVGEAETSPEIDWLLRNGYTVSLPKAGTKLSEKQAASYQEMLRSDDPDNFEPFLTEDHQYQYIQDLGPQLKELLNNYSNRYPQGFDENVQKRLSKDVRKLKSSVKRRILNQ